MKGTLLVIEVEGYDRGPDNVSPELQHVMESHARDLKRTFESRSIQTEVHCHLLDDGALGIAFIEDMVTDAQRKDFRDLIELTSGVIQHLANAKLVARGLPPKMRCTVMHDCSFELRESARGDGP